LRFRFRTETRKIENDKSPKLRKLPPNKLIWRYDPKDAFGNWIREIFAGNRIHEGSEEKCKQSKSGGLK
jgi:hypothetical protein